MWFMQGQADDTSLFDALTTPRCGRRAMAARIGERIRELRKERGLTQRALAERVGVSQQNVSQIEKGDRQPQAEELPRFARALGVPVSSLFPSEEETATVPVMGYVGAGAEIYSPEEDQELDRVEAPWRATNRLAAVVVRGESMEPEFHDGDIIFYEEPNSMDPERLVGRTAVVRTEDGRTYVKRILRGSKPGLWTLESHAAPPLKDVRLLWVAPIRYIKRAVP